MFTQDKITIAVAEAYKNMLQRPKIAHIYCDMDGVLADFMGGAKKVLGYEFNDPDLEKVSSKEKIAKTENFWENLDPIPGGMRVWKFINKYEPRILTAYPSWDEDGKHGKKIWVKNHLHLPEGRFFAVRRHEKQDYAKDKVSGMPNLLIDDYAKNIKEFENAGGIGIRYIDDNQTISELKKLGFR
jgi:hypothetical protein